MNVLNDLPAGMSTQVGGGEEEQGKKSQQAQQEEQMRRDVMSTVLDTGARERCKFYSRFLSYYHLKSSLPSQWHVKYHG